MDFHSLYLLGVSTIVNGSATGKHGAENIQHKVEVRALTLRIPPEVNLRYIITGTSASLSTPG
jgi:hypothetical protein